MQTWLNLIFYTYDGGYPKIVHLKKKSCNIHPNIPQTQVHNNNNLNLSIVRKSFILKLNRLVYLII